MNELGFAVLFGCTIFFTVAALAAAAFARDSDRLSTRGVMILCGFGILLVGIGFLLVASILMQILAKLH